MMMIRSTSLLFFCGLYILLSVTGLVVVQSFTTTQSTTTTKSISTFGVNSRSISSIDDAIISSSSLFMANKDPSRSGTKKDRMNRLAEMEDLGSANDDKGVFIKAAGGFVALIVIAIAAAASSGLLTQY